ncbi:MAG: pyridoxal-phosphate dependent enzyme [Deltaproteobacteria bacterium]|nr:pyridoxal-phosphate dependent enzyme [Deltaproteobacteria bacterium]
MIPLFSVFEGLSHLPYCSLATLPTPVEKLAGLSKQLGHDGLYIKRDDLSGRPYGGNKVRKLEFILADARGKGACSIVTSGAAGSNHALATAMYGRKLGFQVELMLFAQPASDEVRANLLAAFHTGARLHHAENYAAHCRMMEDFLCGSVRQGEPPYCIPPGGSCALGAIGYVNAACELKMQIDCGEIPEPDEIFVAYGTMGTAAGLALGIRLAGLRSRVRAIRVVPDVVANAETYQVLCEATKRLLIESDPALAAVEHEPGGLSADGSFFGPGYGQTTPASDEAIEMFERCEGIMLDRTYTGKTAAAFLGAARNGPPDRNLLFWLTKNSCPLSPESQSIDYRRLPEEFHRYFEAARPEQA